MLATDSNAVTNYATRTKTGTWSKGHYDGLYLSLRDAQQALAANTDPTPTTALTNARDAAQTSLDNYRATNVSIPNPDTPPIPATVPSWRNWDQTAYDALLSARETSRDNRDLALAALNDAETDLAASTFSVLTPGPLSLQGGGKVATVELGGNESARELAAKLDGIIPGLKAQARTEVRLETTGIPANFSLSVGGVSVELVGIDSDEALARQLESNSAKLNISVARDPLRVTSESGEDIVIGVQRDPVTHAPLATSDTSLRASVMDSNGRYADPVLDIYATGSIITGYLALDSDTPYVLYGTPPDQVDVGELFVNAKAELTSITDSGILTAFAAQSSVAAIDKAMAMIDSQRAHLGAMQNRMDNTIANLQNISENVSAARSRILDVDFAAETAALAKNQVLQQAGTAILAQANQTPQAVLNLLR